MSSPDVTIDGDENYKKVLCHTQIESALQIAVQLPELYDYIYENFPDAYNKSGGNYGRISAVRSLNKTNKVKYTPFFNKDMAKYRNDGSIENPGVASPDGFIMPFVYGLQALIERKGDVGAEKIVWTTEPQSFLEKNLEKLVKNYADILKLCDYDPQKVGKATQSYTLAVNTFKMVAAGMLQ